MEPASGVSKPAISRSTVVFPAPEGPNRTVTECLPKGRPRAAVIWGPPGCRLRTSTLSSLPIRGPYGPDLPAQSVGGRQNQKGDAQQKKRSVHRGGVVERLHVVINRDG